MVPQHSLHLQQHRQQNVQMNSPQAAAITGRRPTTSAKCPARGDASKASNEVLLVIADKSNVVNGRPRSSCIETRVELMTPVLSDVLLLLRYNRKGQTVRTGDGHPSRSPGYRLLSTPIISSFLFLSANTEAGAHLNKLASISTILFVLPIFPSLVCLNYTALFDLVGQHCPASDAGRYGHTNGSSSLQSIWFLAP
ncbi:hypothetical protein KCV06_g278, partial [Aureobasidium melanogenum]